MLPHDPILNRCVAKEVFLDDAMAFFRGYPAIPDSLGVDGHPRALAADAETTSLGPQNGNPKLLDPVFKDLPTLHSLFFGAAIGTDAQEYVALGGVDAHF